MNSLKKKDKFTFLDFYKKSLCIAFCLVLCLNTFSQPSHHINNQFLAPNTPFNLKANIDVEGVLNVQKTTNLENLTEKVSENIINQNLLLGFYNISPTIIQNKVKKLIRSIWPIQNPKSPLNVNILSRYEFVTKLSNIGSDYFLKITFQLKEETTQESLENILKKLYLNWQILTFEFKYHLLKLFQIKLSFRNAIILALALLCVSKTGIVKADELSTNLEEFDLDLSEINLVLDENNPLKTFASKQNVLEISQSNNNKPDFFKNIIIRGRSVPQVYNRHELEFETKLGTFGAHWRRDYFYKYKEPFTNTRFIYKKLLGQWDVNATTNFISTGDNLSTIAVTRTQSIFKGTNTVFLTKAGVLGGIRHYKHKTQGTGSIYLGGLLKQKVYSDKLHFLTFGSVFVSPFENGYMPQIQTQAITGFQYSPNKYMDILLGYGLTDIRKNYFGSPYLNERVGQFVFNERGFHVPHHGIAQLKLKNFYKSLELIFTFLPDLQNMDSADPFPVIIDLKFKIPVGKNQKQKKSSTTIIKLEKNQPTQKSLKSSSKETVNKVISSTGKALINLFKVINFSA